MTYPLLSILIPTTIDRRNVFTPLRAELISQIERLDLIGTVEVLHIEDNKEISVGLKRQKLLELSKAKWIVYFDSDDEPYSWYIEDIYKAITENEGIDCIGINIDMTTNGAKPQRCCHSLKYPVWSENVDGWDYVRNVTHRNPVLRELALKVGFENIRFGEDKIYSDLVTLLCRNEFYIERPNFHYKYSTKELFKNKYGIK